jgi:MIP family channel proteins
MWRRYLAELLGTFFILLFGCGSIATLGNADVANHLAVNAVFGLAVAASIYALGHISAAHFNPAVTLGFAVAKRFPWRYVPGYVLSQAFGAVSAAGVHYVLIQEKAASVSYGATLPKLPIVPSLVTEGILTFFLMLVIISVATDRRVNGAVPGMAIGMAVCLCGLFGGVLTGCSMNPARSLGPALFAGREALDVLWIYVVGPVIGASAGAVVYEAMRGGAQHGQGAPNDLFMAMNDLAEAATQQTT